MLRTLPGRALVTARAEDAPLSELLARLRDAAYRFTTVTPETHRRFLARAPGRRARSLRDVFGWSLPFAAGATPDWVETLLRQSDMLDEESGLLRAKVRVSSLGAQLFLHSAHPTDAADAVFFGPDTYRFARFLAAELPAPGRVRILVDIGAGSGAGAIVAGLRDPALRLMATDINPLALRFAGINARHAGLDLALVPCSGLNGAAGAFDLAIANPPFMMDPASRAYRDGGGMLGAALSLAWAEAAAARLAPGGRMLLYTASAIVAGEDRLAAALGDMLPPLGCTLRYAELDPDIFGEQLGQAGYEAVERIAAVGAVIDKG